MDRFSTLDVHLAAFLELHGISSNLERQGHRVVFTFQDSEANDLINAFNRNVLVPVADFVSTLKGLRGRMYQVRDNHEYDK